MGAMLVVNQVPIPADVKDLQSFRRWARSKAFPRSGRFSYLDRQLWVDTSMEQLITHNRVKTEISVVLAGLVKQEKRGYFFTDRALLSHEHANLSTEPDGVFVSFASLEAKRISFVEGKKVGFVEVEGSADMVLEVVSAHSVRKDTEVLRDLYWRAGIPEYWLVDARRAPIRFDILQRTTRGYVPNRRRQGWVKSAIFSRSFTLQETKDRLGHSEYTLHVK